MKLYLPVIIAFLVVIDIACGAVGDGGVSDGSTYIQPDQAYSAGTAPESYAQSSISSGATLASSTTPYQSGLSQYGELQRAYQPVQGSQVSSNPQTATYSAPETNGPYRESLSAEDLALSMPQAENFRPDKSLNFVSATLPSELKTVAYGPSNDASMSSGSWYYPGSVISSNKFYIQTASGLVSVAGCGYGGYLPLWADINSGGNFYVYEWYPGQYTPSVRWWGWTWPGFKKGWFSGDVPGWHILSYNCRDWSNYIYIYVFPASGLTSSYGYANGPAVASLPAGSPTPPDPNAESLVLPDFNLYKPTVVQATQGGYSGYAAQAGYPAMGSYPGTAKYNGGSGIITQTGSSTKVCTTCKSEAITEVPGSGSLVGICPTCTASGSMTAPYGYVSGNYKSVYPVSSTCKCNEYYVQSQPGKLGTVAGVFYGEWLALWSKVGKPGVYWSSEWMVCQNQKGYYCSPDVRNFGAKNAGWYQTWFRGNKAGWHIMSYYCSDWSNYIYIYVWPAE